jgi:hypothetical protein
VFRTPVQIGSAWMTLDCFGVDGPLLSSGPCQLSSSVLTSGAWSAPVRVSGSPAGRVRGYAGAETGDGSYVLLFGKRPTRATAGLWSVRLTDGTWGSPQPIVAARKSASTPSPAAPVVTPSGSVSAVWIDGRRVAAARSR